MSLRVSSLFSLETIAPVAWAHKLPILKAELETWDAALKAYDAEDFEKALDLFGVSFAK